MQHALQLICREPHELLVVRQAFFSFYNSSTYQGISRWVYHSIGTARGQPRHIRRGQMQFQLYSGHFLPRIFFSPPSRSQTWVSSALWSLSYWTRNTTYTAIGSTGPALLSTSPSSQRICGQTKVTKATAWQATGSFWAFLACSQHGGCERAQ